MSAEEFFSSLKWVKEKIERKVFDSIIICGDFSYPGINWREYVGTSVDLNELNFIEKLEDSFITQVIDFGTFSSGNVLDLVLISEPERILEILKRPPLGDIMTAQIVLEFNFAIGFNKKVENKDKMKDLSFNTVSDNTYELMAAPFEETDWNSVLGDLGCEDLYIKFLEVYHKTCSGFIKPKREWKANGEAWLNYEVRNLIKEKNKLWHIRRRSRENSKKYKLLSKKLKTSTKNAIETYENSIANKSKKEPKLVYSYMKRKLDNKERIHFLRNEEGQVVTDRDLIANSLNDHFSSVCEIESKVEKMPNFEPRTDKILSIDLIMQKLCD